MEFRQLWIDRDETLDTRISSTHVIPRRTHYTIVKVAQFTTYEHNSSLTKLNDK